LGPERERRRERVKKNGGRIRVKERKPEKGLKCRGRRERGEREKEGMDAPNFSDSAASAVSDVF